MLKDGVFYKGDVPENYHLAASPSPGMVILDVDKKKDKNGYLHIPEYLRKELNNTYWYKTKSGGAHVFINYTGNKTLRNCSTKFGLDLRISADNYNCGGYVRWQGDIKPEECISLIKDSSKDLNIWLEKLFG